jgi:hypothetical protein
MSFVQAPAIGALTSPGERVHHDIVEIASRSQRGAVSELDLRRIRRTTRTSGRRHRAASGVHSGLRSVLQWQSRSDVLH